MHKEHTLRIRPADREDSGVVSRESVVAFDADRAAVEPIAYVEWREIDGGAPVRRNLHLACSGRLSIDDQRDCLL